MLQSSAAVVKNKTKCEEICEDHNILKPTTYVTVILTIVSYCSYVQLFGHPFKTKYSHVYRFMV